MTLAETLRTMPIGNTQVFPLAKHASLCSTRQRLKLEPELVNAHWSIVTNPAKSMVTVKRTK